MSRFRSILVPLDASPLAERAIPLAASLAERASGSLHLAMVHVPAPAWALPQIGAADPALDQEIRSGEGRYLSRRLQDTAAGTSVPVSEALLDGDIPEAIAEYAADRQADLIVMTTHGRGPVSRFWLGSVADRLIRCTDRPVLLLHPAAARVPARVEQLQRILVPLDGSPLAELAESPALMIARLSGGVLDLFRVVEPAVPIWAPFPGGALPGEAPDSLRLRVEHAERELEERAEAIRAAGVSVGTGVLVGPDPAGAILHRVQEVTADLIVLATHGRGGLSRVLLGSVTDKVVRAAPVPVLVCPPGLRPAEMGAAVAAAVATV
jgi:nucleotide-binding universal stress UspA family protein